MSIQLPRVIAAARPWLVVFSFSLLSTLFLFSNSHAQLPFGDCYPNPIINGGYTGCQSLKPNQPLSEFKVPEPKIEIPFYSPVQAPEGKFDCEKLKELVDGFLGDFVLEKIKPMFEHLKSYQDLMCSQYNYELEFEFTYRGLRCSYSHSQYCYGKSMPFPPTPTNGDEAVDVCSKFLKSMEVDSEDSLILEFSPEYSELGDLCTCGGSSAIFCEGLGIIATSGEPHIPWF